MEDEYIHIKGARVNNLKDITVDIPRNKLVVITGLSGSGKSSLAFDTLYAEGQRRYVESLSAYARQFLGRMHKPDVDFITGIAPAIAIEQKVTSRNPRSTVGTSTEIYDYLKLLYARIGKTYSPISGQEVKKHQPQDVVDYAMSQPKGTKIMLLAPINKSGSALIDSLNVWYSQGFTRLFASGTTLQISDCLASDSLLKQYKQLYLLIDRIVSDGEQSTANRFADSVETAFFEGDGECKLYILNNSEKNKDVNFSIRFEADGISFMQPSEHLFDFNSPIGACPRCEGFGNIIGIDPDLVVPDKTLSIRQGAIACWRGEVMSQWNDLLVQTAHNFNFPIDTPFYALTEEQRHLIWLGNSYFRGLNAFFQMLEEKQYSKIQYRVMLSRYRGKTICPDCMGGRLRKESSYVRINDKTITDLVTMPISELRQWFKELKLSKTDTLAAKRLLTEITSRLQFLSEVGLDYLTLNRLSSTLSGGESQRINLATSLGSSLVGSMYILDEPSIGLHPRDTEQLIKVLKQLRDIGNTVIVVEHDEEIIRAADYIIDIGPDAGRLGGKVVYQGPNQNLKNVKQQEGLHSYTLDYLTGKERISIPKFRRFWNNSIIVEGACENNLKNITVCFPLNVMTVVTGVSGSGKSSLVSRVLYPALKKYYGGVAERTGFFGSLKGDLSQVKDIEYIDQNPIGKSTRSNAITYLKAYDEIRRLYAEQQLSKQMGFTPSHFSFNSPGGRCEECAGEGKIHIEMQFMPDIVLECEHCHGKRFKSDVLEVEYKGKSIYDILEMTINQAIEFFSEEKDNVICQRIVKRLKPLQDVGIGYIKMGQDSSTLSGGESQRVKLAYFLSTEKIAQTIFVFDEPTTGLHYHDIKILLSALNALIARGHTIIIIEHNPAVIMSADYVIDLGPEGGKDGGQVVACGTPEEIMQVPESYTGRALLEYVG